MYNTGVWNTAETRVSYLVKLQETENLYGMYALPSLKHTAVAMQEEQFEILFNVWNFLCKSKM